MDGAARRCSGPAGCSQQLRRLHRRHMLKVCPSLWAANNNPDPSSQDRQGRRGAVQWLGRASSGLWVVQG